MNTPAVITVKGREVLGRFLKKTRESNQMSLDACLLYIKAQTGEDISKSTLSELERGNSVPRWDTISILAFSGLFRHPMSNKPLTAAQMFEIACELFDPFTGEHKDQNGSIKGSQRIRTDRLEDQNRSERIRISKRLTISRSAFNGSDRALVLA